LYSLIPSFTTPVPSTIMPSDKDTLLSMGFDPARVECMRYPSVSIALWPQLICTPVQFTGAVKATGGRGLQPAMDHILENEGNPVPDLGSVTSSSSGSRAQPMDVDEEDDEDAEALRALTGKAGSAVSSGAAAEAKASN
jgi:hypothetical protein